jgi:uroporphyrin-III C-methyltransferase/precorrin-2 dehydrogenase/sirohydrochlorin ferrochelatase
MGVGASAQIESKLLLAGRDPSTPIAIVENGTHANERRLTGTLGDLSALVQRETVTGPSIIFVGETAAFANRAAQPALEYSA